VTNACGTCGHTHSQAIGEAKTLGLAQEFQSGIHTCCQIAEWAAEQRLAWFEATLDCGKPNADATVLDEMESVLVRVRTQPAQVPWFRNTNDLGR
jgi:hypothetical protein